MPQLPIFMKWFVLQSIFISALGAMTGYSLKEERKASASAGWQQQRDRKGKAVDNNPKETIPGLHPVECSASGAVNPSNALQKDRIKVTTGVTAHIDTLTAPIHCNLSYKHCNRSYRHCNCFCSNSVYRSNCFCSNSLQKQLHCL